MGRSGGARPDQIDHIDFRDSEKKTKRHKKKGDSTSLLGRCTTSGHKATVEGCTAAVTMEAGKRESISQMKFTAARLNSHDKDEIMLEINLKRVNWPIDQVSKGNRINTHIAYDHFVRGARSAMKR